MTTSMEPPRASARLFPPPCPLERLPPAGLELLALRGFHRVREAAVDLPLRRDLLLVLPVADRQTREIRRAQRRGLGDFRPHYGYTQQVRLKLHQQIVGRRAAVHAQLLQSDLGVGFHRAE